MEIVRSVVLPRHVWVTGGTGFVGQQLLLAADRLLPGCEVVAVSRHPEQLPGGCSTVVPLPLDLAEAGRLEQAFRAAPPGGVIHLAAAADPNWCQEHPEEARRLNVDVPRRLADLCREAGSRLVFVSTDLVFDGHAAPYGETAVPRPPSQYAAMKLEAERAVAAVLGERATICRLPLMYGDPSPSGRDPQGMVWAALAGGPPARLFIDEFRTPISTVAAAEGLTLALGLARPVPLLHLGGPERLSRYELATRLAAWLGRPTDRLVPVRQTEVPMAAPRPPDVSLDSRLAGSLGFRPRPLEAEWERLPGFVARRAAPASGS
ncbi:MAG: NAD(P)-dependent oxidoreductase [Candidatus Riflebacteria bacterium]|nr:NAD(P)-dependent oxidoreductase [Candidatus Riflebacteria bacterium]